jgi:hypothetical protein
MDFEDMFGLPILDVAELGTINRAFPLLTLNIFL